MKRIIASILLLSMVFSLCCCAEAAAENIPEANSAAAIQEATPQASDDPEQTLFLKVSAITFSLVGESEDIYLGLVPREKVIWESEDPSIVSVEGGVLTAVGVGTTKIYASYGEQKICITAGCLAQTQEELGALDYDILCQPKRMLPEVDLEQPCTYFDDAALVGDSISYMLLQSESKGDYLGNLLFLARGGASLGGFVLRYKNVYFKGHEMNLEDAIAEAAVERIYILIGASDLGVPAHFSAFFDNWDTMLGRIREKSPNVEIVIISIIPRYGTQTERTGPLFRQYNTDVIDTNEKLRKYAGDNGCLYIDLHAYIEDHSGCMAAIYNLDGFHLNDTGYRTWMKVMRYYAQYELEGGTLS